MFVINMLFFVLKETVFNFSDNSICDLIIIKMEGKIK